jgi:hypothetical protein
MRKQLIIALLLSLIVFGGCEKQLNIKSTFFSDESHALNSVDGMDAGLSTAYSYVYGLEGLTLTLWSELMADHLHYVIGASSTKTNYANYYNRDLNAVIGEQVSATDTRSVNDIILRQLYDGTNTASLIIRGVNTGLANKDLAFATNKNRLLGEAYFIRAVGYFEMVKLWAKAWNATPDNSHLGLVVDSIPVDDRVSQLKARAPVSVVYAFIISDLNRAISLLPTGYDASIYPAPYNGRTYKDGAIAFLARVYFQQQNYVKAKQMIDLVIGSTAGSPSKHPLNSDVNAPFATRGATNQDPENILQNTASLNVNSLSTFWYSANTSVFKVGTTVVSLVSYASDAFTHDANYLSTDLRLTNWFNLVGGVGGKYIPTKYTKVAQINIPLIRSAEMILDRAEINAMANNLQDAINDCNAIRTRAQIPLVVAPISQNDLLAAIRTERIRELCFEGDRLWNLKRMEVPIPPGDRGTANLPWDGVELVEKYLPAELSINPLLVNN